MKRITVFALALLAPVVMFAQVPPDRAALALKRLGLTSDQVTKVNDITKATETTIKDDRIHLKLLQAQIQDAILPSTATPDMAAIDKLVDQESQLRGNMEKALLSAEVQLIQIMGRDNFERYFQMIRARFGMGGQRAMREFHGQPMWGQARGTMMNGAAPYAWRENGSSPMAPNGQAQAPSGYSN